MLEEIPSYQISYWWVNSHKNLRKIINMDNMYIPPIRNLVGEIFHQLETKENVVNINISYKYMMFIFITCELEASLLQQ